MLLIVLKSVKDTEQHQTRSRNQPSKQRKKARELSPFGIIGQSVKLGRVSYMMDCKDRAGKRNAGDGTASDEYWLEDKGANVTDEGNLGVDLSGISWLADENPSKQEDREGAKPGETCCKWKDPEFVGVSNISPENSRPEPSHCEKESAKTMQLYVDSINHDCNRRIANHLTGRNWVA